MALYAYQKAPVGRGKVFFQAKVLLSRYKKVFSWFLLPGGSLLILTVLYSIFSYQLLVFRKSRGEIIAPISKIAVAEARGMVNPLVAGVFTQKAYHLPDSTEGISYDLINSWFPTAPTPAVRESKITHYTLSIPKVRIENAIVQIGGVKIKENLIHYPGTALPGEFGKVVVFGHSILPIFYNPEDYKSIFSLIPTLKEGDRIYISFDGIEYVYEVFDYQEVQPEEINVLEQHFDQQTLNLITCVPPGTYLRRGVVKARLIKH